MAEIKLRGKCSGFRIFPHPVHRFRRHGPPHLVADHSLDSAQKTASLQIIGKPVLRYDRNPSLPQDDAEQFRPHQNQRTLSVFPVIRLYFAFQLRILKSVFRLQMLILSFQRSAHLFKSVAHIRLLNLTLLFL